MELRRKRKRGSVPTAQGLDKLENAIQIKEDLDTLRSKDTQIL